MRENCSSNYGKHLGNGFSHVRGEKRSLYVVLLMEQPRKNTPKAAGGIVCSVS